MLEAMQAGEFETLADFIEANGGDLDEIVAAIVAQAGDDAPEDLTEKVTERLTTPRTERDGEKRRTTWRS